MSIFEGMRWYYELCGIRGTAVVASFKLLAIPRQLTIVPRGLTLPVHLRLGTSDFCAYRDVLVCSEKDYDPRLVDFDPQVIVDIGAHIGMASIAFASRYPRARIVAVEPEPDNFARLMLNIAGYKNITAVRAALWKHDGEVHLAPSQVHPKGAFAISECGSIPARAITMCTLMNEMGIRVIDLLKIDIEGSEKEVFQACDWIDTVRTIAIELHDRVQPGCRDALQLAAKGFRFEERGEITFCLNHISPLSNLPDALAHHEIASQSVAVGSAPC
jgi:FkbM family methyltransferase